MSERRFNRGGERRGGGGHGPGGRPDGGGAPRYGRGGGGGRARGESGGGKGGKVASVGVRFGDVAGVHAFFLKLGMPDSLVRQLGGWLQELEPGEAERMEPELGWEGRPEVLRITAELDEDGDGVDVEFEGVASLIEAVQAELDEFFRPKQQGQQGRKKK